jgi:hypothetical protein
MPIPTMTVPGRRRSLALHAAILGAILLAAPLGATLANPNGQDTSAMTADPLLTLSAPPPQRDGLHDFDFLIGEWKAHLRKRLNPLTGSIKWVEYDGTSRTHKLWDDRANTEEFEVEGPEDKRHIKAQTLRLYNPETREWSIYLVDAAKGTLSLPPTIGHFTDGRGEFYDYEEFNGRWIFVRYVWTSPSPNSATMVQSFSADGGKSWEANWICELTREKA